MKQDDVRRLTDERKQLFDTSARGSFTCVVQPDLLRNKGHYGVMYAKASKRIAASLGISREVLVLVTTFADQQARTTEVIEYLIRESEGRLEANTAIVVHEDHDGNSKLRDWGRERGIVVLPLNGSDLASRNFRLDSYLSTELFSHDPFDVTGPVSDDMHFFGRRDEALDLARKLATGAIRSCLGVRKIGKTSILNRVIANLERNHDCHTIFVDCSKDAVWSGDATSLTEWIASTVMAAVVENRRYLALDARASPPKSVDITSATSKLQAAVESATKPVVLILDEIDYITPGSPTAAERWRSEFNPFWRNFRSVYQEATRSSKKVAVLVAGVSSRWFFVGRVGDVENAALALIPEEYLSPLPRRATEEMIKTLAKRAGLQFDRAALSEVASSAGDLPYWSRKICSFIHQNIDVDGRPRKVDSNLAKHLVGRFVDSEGGAISRVAIAHLLSVYPELRKPSSLCSEGKGSECSAGHARILERYGVIRDNREVAGRMMQLGLTLALSSDEGMEASAESAPVGVVGPIAEWAEELALVGRRRNILEKRIRSIVANLLRFDSLTTKDKLSARERVLKAVNDKRKKELDYLPLDDLMERLFWPELIALAGREWSTFERVFGAKDRFIQAAEIINDRPDAHAKGYDEADFALYRRSLKVIEDALKALD